MSRWRLLRLGLLLVVVLLCNTNSHAHRGRVVAGPMSLLLPPACLYDYGPKRSHISSLPSPRTNLVTRVEAFWDIDPGIGLGTLLPALDGVYNDPLEAFSGSLAAPTDPGIHYLYIRTLDGESVISTIYYPITVDEPLVGRSNKLEVAECFFDIDPGQGMGIPLTAQDGSVDGPVEALMANLPLTLTPGQHLLYIRTRDAEGNWSATQYYAIEVEELPVGRSNRLAAAEYTWDFFNSTTIVANDGTFDDPLELLTASGITTPSFPGQHILYIRAQDADGNWSPYTRIPIFVDPPLPPVLDNPVTRVAYNWDNYPTFGGGTTLQTGNTNLMEIAGTVPTTGLTPGQHLLYLWVEDGATPNPRQRFVLVPVLIEPPLPPARANTITKVAAYWDTDPGLNNESMVLPFTGSQPLATIDWSGLPLPATHGFHRLFIRAYNEDGFATTITQAVHIDPPLPSARAIALTTATWYWDVDPAVGTPAGSISFTNQHEFSIAAPTSGLSVGDHKLHVKVTDAQGRSRVVTQVITVELEEMALTCNAVSATNIQWCFSEPVSSSSGIHVSGNRDGYRSGTFGGLNSSTVTFTPTRSFHASEELHITLAGLTSSSGGAMLPKGTYKHYVPAALAPATFLTNATGLSNPTPFKVVKAGDIDGDGDADLVVFRGQAGVDGYKVSTYANAGNGTFSYWAESGAFYPGEVADLRLVDLNNDGKLDLVQSYNTSQGLFSYGLTNATTHQINSGNNLASNQPLLQLAVGDFDLDGDQDVVGASMSGNVQTYVNNLSSAGFMDQFDFPAFTNCYAVATGDHDADGRMDVLAAGFDIGTGYAVKVLRNTGISTTIPSIGAPVFDVVATVPLPLGAVPNSLQAADLDGDNDLDALVACANGVYLLRNNGGSFTTTQVGSAFANPLQLQLADLNGDDKLDAVTTNGFLLNQGGGNFTTTLLDLGGAVVAADVDGDRDIDFVSAATAPQAALFTHLNEPLTLAPTISGFTPAVGIVGTAVTITGANFTGLTAVTFDGTPAIIGSYTPTSITVQVPSGASTGRVAVTNGAGTGTSSTDFVVLTDLVAVNGCISGQYNNVLIPAGVDAELCGDLTMLGNLTVMGRLNMKGFRTTGNMVLMSTPAATLATSHALGFTGGQNLNFGTYAISDGSFEYLGAVPQVTGDKLPPTVHSLRIANNVSLQSALSIRHTLYLDAGEFNANGRTVTLLSSASGTARIHEAGPTATVINGANFRQQRYLPPSLALPNGSWVYTAAGLHNVQVGNWAVNNPYAVYTYDNSRPANSSVWFYNNSDVTWPQNAGYIKPANTNYAVPAGQGARIWFRNPQFFTAGSTWQASGIPVVGTFTLPVTYCPAGCADDSIDGTSDNGFNLVGNPYCSTIDWDAPGWTMANMEPTVSIWQDANHNFAQYVRGIGGINGGGAQIAAGQAFFVRATGPAPQLRISESCKVASDVNPKSANPLPRLRLQMTGSTGTDQWLLVLHNQGTQGQDAGLDATKMKGPVMQMGSMVGTTCLGIDVRDNVPNMIPLRLLSREPVTITLPENTLGQSVAGSIWLVSPAGVRHDLSNPVSLHTNGLPQIWHLQFGQVTGIPSSVLPQLSFYPNPSNGLVHVTGLQKPSVVFVANAAGQRVHEQVLQPAEPLDLRHLATGMYSVRVDGQWYKVVRQD